MAFSFPQFLANLWGLSNPPPRSVPASHHPERSHPAAFRSPWMDRLAFDTRHRDRRQTGSDIRRVVDGGAPAAGARDPGPCCGAMLQKLQMLQEKGYPLPPPAPTAGSRFRTPQQGLFVLRFVAFWHGGMTITLQGVRRKHDEPVKGGETEETERLTPAG